eukprot:CAMPEP_0114982798 /NCGR_PEP_ID=MMETSP0216-20121206/6333_1 /TAXON_ID=223996 /ORGANISM="Protocruzia adherens, Strain Boccale" /LENGTH=61 /DNA_ID=CAMNT_0002344687 /DNA_START=699 /DNA_END=884 /DNA_ORIENTATION=+
MEEIAVTKSRKEIVSSHFEEYREMVKTEAKARISSEESSSKSPHAVLATSSLELTNITFSK